MGSTVAAELALSAPTTGGGLPLLEAAGPAPLRSQPVEATPVVPGKPTLDELIELAVKRYPEDYLLAQTMKLARSRTDHPAALAALDDRYARLLLEQAMAAEGLIKQHRLQVAIEGARNRGVP